MQLVHKNEKPLFVISLIIGTLVWIALTVGTFGAILIYALLAFLLYLFAHSAFIAHLRGNAVELSQEQLPDLYGQYRESCATLGIEEPPRAYLMMSDGILNALATRFLRRHYVVVFSSVVDALRSRPEALRFYFGHELGHVMQGHLRLRWLLWPASILPLLGAAYRRAQEYTCDLHGLATSKSPGDALSALALLGSGGGRLPQVNIERMIEQQQQSGGFWMSFHELTGDYPWLCKRMANVSSAAEGSASNGAPSRNFFAWLLALFVPRLGFAGSAGGLLVLVAIIGVLAAIAIPAYQDYTLRAEVTGGLNAASDMKRALQEYIEREGGYPDSLEEAGVPAELHAQPMASFALTEEGLELTMNSANLKLDGKTIVFTAFRTDDGRIDWTCDGGSLPHKWRPASCRPGADAAGP